MHELGDLRSALGDVFDVDKLADQAVVSGIDAIIRAENALAANRLAMLAIFDRRGLGLKLRSSSTARWLATGTRVADGDAGHQVSLAHWLADWPTVMSALVDGNIHVAHARAIEDGYNHILTADPTLAEDEARHVVDRLLAVAYERTVTHVNTRAQELAHAAAEAARARYEEALREHAREEQKRGTSAPDESDGAGDHGGTSDGDADGGLDGAVDRDGTDARDNSGVGSPASLLHPGPPPLPVAENAALNRLDIYPQANGRSTLTGNLDKLTAEKLRSSLSPLCAPQPAIDGTRDHRSESKRNADALTQLLDHYLSGDRTRGSGAARAKVNVIVNLRDLLADPRTDAGNGVGQAPADARETQAGELVEMTELPTRSASQPTPTGHTRRPPTNDADGPFSLDWTGPISLTLAQLLTCDADLTPIIVDNADVPLAMGRTSRLTTQEQRVAVTVRDRGCVKCGRPAQWCQIHHLTYWTDGGRTDLANLALVCSDCHRIIHHTNWQLAMDKDGHPYLTPPAAVDPVQKPIPSYHRRRKPAA